MSSYNQTTVGIRHQISISCLCFSLDVSLFLIYGTQVLSSRLEKQPLTVPSLPPSKFMTPERKAFSLQFQGKETQGRTWPAQFGPCSPCGHPGTNCCSLNVQTWITWAPLWPKSQGPMSCNPTRITWVERGRSSFKKGWGGVVTRIRNAGQIQII